MPDTSTSLADVARAITVLSPPADEIDRIAALLGFRRAPEPPAPSTASPPPTSVGAHKLQPASPSLPSAEPSPPSRVSAVASKLEVLAKRPSNPRWKLLDALEPPATTAPLPVETLFDPRWTRAILGALAAARRPSGDIDVARLTAQLVRGLAIKHLPYKLRWTLAHGAQLLVDHAPSMMPFALDRRDLTARLKRVAGNGLQVMGFELCPARGVFYQGDLAPYRPPPGLPVLLLTTFGLGPRAPSESRVPIAEWAAFLDILLREGCPVIALVPGTGWHVPAPIADRAAVIAWDRSTTSRRVRAERRRVERRVSGTR
jgi:hypothetical protein